MRDVAALAGVSVKTVSRVINRQPHIRPELIARVEAAVEKLGWTPNPNARALRRGRTGTIAVIVTELRRPYLATLVEALAVEAGHRGLGISVETTHGDPIRTRERIAKAQRRHDGMIVLGPWPLPESPETLTGTTPPIIVQGGSHCVSADHVTENVTESLRLVARHLAVMGRARPVLLGTDRGHTGADADPGLPSSLLLDVFTEAGIAPAQLNLVAVEGSPDRTAGARAARQALAAFPDADSLVCATDELALGAMAALTQSDIAVPERVAVIGYDCLDDGRFSTPSLTTVDPGVNELARSALDLHESRLGGRSRSTTVEIPARLVRRESTMGLPR